MKIFLAGIIQGSIKSNQIHEQDYRATLKGILRKALPEAELVCPIENHPNSLGYSFDRGRNVFQNLIECAAEADILLAYLPEASMGTAVEMWEAFNRGKLVISISPMPKNWTIKFLSHKIFSNVEEFQRFAESGNLATLYSEHEQKAAQRAAR